jgi:hypothetical protein
MGFKDKDAKAARAIFRKREGEADHAEYEFQTWKGEFFLVTVIWYIFVFIGIQGQLMVSPYDQI